MYRQFLACVAVGVLVVGALGCGGSGTSVYQDQAPGPIETPGLDKALQAEREGKELTGKQKRVLEDAREAGAIPPAAGDAPAPAA